MFYSVADGWFGFNLSEAELFSQVDKVTPVKAQSFEKREQIG